MNTLGGTAHIDPAAIERELSGLWAQADGAGQGAGVTRAAMSNVILFCRGGQQADDASARIPQLVAEHPSRILVLVADPEFGNHQIEARVTAHCRRIDEYSQLCAEHIELRFHEAGAERAASVLRSLLIGDLPTALWWTSPEPPARAGILFDEFGRLANQIIYDSLGWSDPAAGVLAMARWARGGRKVLFNLAWRRLKPWRRMLSQSLAPSILPGALQGISDIEVRHGPHALPMVWLLVGWLASRLGWRAEKGQTAGTSRLVWQFVSPAGPVRVVVAREDEGAPEISRLRIGWPGGHAEYAREGHHLRCYPGAADLLATSIPLSARRKEHMVAAQLAHRAGDPLFENALDVSESMGRVLRAG